MRRGAVRRPNPRGALRRALLVAGIVPAIVVLLLAWKVATMLQANAAGRDAFDRGDYDGASAEFTDTRSFNWFERWVAPFDVGASLHADALFDEAITAYEDALEVVPDRDECTVRINLALAHEAVGDARAAEQDHDGAIESWQAGIDVLAAGECPTDAGRGQEQSDDAAAVDERLRAKVQQSQEQQQEQPEEQPPPESQDPGDEPGEDDPRQERLERNNDQGRQQRSEEQDLYQDNDYSRPNSW